MRDRFGNNLNNFVKRRRTGSKKCDNRFEDGIILRFFNNMKIEREICNFLEVITV